MFGVYFTPFSMIFLNRYRKGHCDRVYSTRKKASGRKELAGNMWKYIILGVRHRRNSTFPFFRMKMGVNLFLL